MNPTRVVSMSFKRFMYVDTAINFALMVAFTAAAPALADATGRRPGVWAFAVFWGITGIWHWSVMHAPTDRRVRALSVTDVVLALAAIIAVVLAGLPTFARIGLALMAASALAMAALRTVLSATSAETEASAVRRPTSPTKLEAREPRPTTPKENVL
jgi:hypothetical protein